jgi:serine/threonine protein kinase
MMHLLRELAGACCLGLLPGATDEDLLRAELPNSLKIVRRLGRGGEGVAFLVEETVWLSAEEAQRLDEEQAAEAEAAGADANAEATPLPPAADDPTATTTPRRGGLLLKARTALGISAPQAGAQQGTEQNHLSTGRSLRTTSTPLPGPSAPAAPRLHVRAWALKAVRRGRDVDAPGLLAEIRNQARLGSHPNIVSLQEVLLTRHFLCLKMDVAAGGPLLDWICAYKPPPVVAAAAVPAAAQAAAAANGTTASAPAVAAATPPQPPPAPTPHMPEPLARYFFVQLAHAVAHCHALRVAHRDLKLANVLLDAGSPPVVKLIDFGLSTTPAMVAVAGAGAAAGGPRALAAAKSARRAGSGRSGSGRTGSGGSGGSGGGGGSAARGRGAGGQARSGGSAIVGRVLRGMSPERWPSSGGATATAAAAHPLPLPAPAAPPALPPLQVGALGGAGSEGGSSSGLSSPAIGASPRSWVATAFGGTYDPAKHGGGAAAAAAAGNGGAFMPPTALGATAMPPSALGGGKGPDGSRHSDGSPLGTPFAALAAAGGGAGGGGARGLSPASSGGGSPAPPPPEPPRLLPRSNTAVGTPAYMAPELLTSIVQRGQAHQQAQRQQQQQLQQQSVGASLATTAGGGTTSTISTTSSATTNTATLGAAAVSASSAPTTVAAGRHHHLSAGAAGAAPAAASANNTAAAAATTAFDNDPSAVAPYDPYKVDVWALGCILFAMLTRRFPFACGATAAVAAGPDGDSLAGLQAQLRAIQAARQPGDEGRTHLRPGLWQELGVSAQAAELLDGMLALDPADRFSLPRVLAHPWCRGVVPRTGGYAGALRRLAWLGAYRADEAAASAVVGGWSSPGGSAGGGSDDGRTLSGGGGSSPLWMRSPSIAGGGGSVGGGGGGASPPPLALGAGLGSGAGGGGRRGRSPPPPSGAGGASPLGGRSPSGASPRGGSPTRLQRRSTAAASFSDTLLQATAAFRGLADGDIGGFEAGGGDALPPAALGASPPPPPAAAAAASAAAAAAPPQPAAARDPHRHHQHPRHHHRHNPPPAPLPAPVLSPECERALEALVHAASKEGTRAAGGGGGPGAAAKPALRWRPRWRQPPPMIRMPDGGSPV